MIAECNSYCQNMYWQNMTYIGRTRFILAEFNFYWQSITSNGRIWLPLAEHDLYWLIVTLAGRIWLILAEYDFHWQNMIYAALLSLLLAEYAANQKCSAVLLCSADSIYPPIIGVDSNSSNIAPQLWLIHKLSIRTCHDSLKSWSKFPI